MTMTTLPNFLLVLPEIFVLSMACVILVVDLYTDDRHRWVAYLLSQVTLAGAAVITLAMMSGQPQVGFHNTFVADPMASVLKLCVYLVTFGVFLYSRGYLQERNLFKGEYFVLGLFGVLGMMVMISGHNFLTLYLGLELLSLSLYSMVAFDRDSPIASEAAMKYFILGALASGMLLYGLSILYGVTGSLDITEVGDFIAGQQDQPVILVFGLCFVVLGLAFKLGAVPFHMWLPDVCQGAPTAVTLYIGSAPKIAAFAMVMRLLVESMGGLSGDWSNMLMILAVLSLMVGNVIAIAQTNIKRMLAYSTISHVGFLLLGILAGTRQGYAASMFYTITYALMAMGGFGMIILLSRKGFEAEQLEDFKGLNERSRWFAFMMLIIMFSLAGVPPTVGFYAKLAVLQAVVQVDMVWLAIVAVFFSFIGLFYYLRVVKLMYFDEQEGDELTLTPSPDLSVALTANGLLVLALGIFPGGLMALCSAVMG
jgi:NADH-quinone oxidoreductase subunit N